MKHFLLTSAAVLIMAASCSPVYYRQVTTLSSDNVKFNDKGDYVYENDIVSIEYNFWTEKGRVDFVVTNNTDDNIYLDLSQSFLIKNGYAYDYFKNRSWQRNSESTVVSSTSNTSGMYVFRTLFGQSYATQQTSRTGDAVSYQEMSVVCIPAHSSKSFGEYSVSSGVYRECDFNRIPKSKEESVREFSQETSPLVIENRLMFILGDVHIPVTNMFYASKYQNISADDEEQNELIRHCNGSSEYVSIHKLYGVNKFFITYDGSDIYRLDGPVMEKERNDAPELGNVSSR